MVRQIDDLGVDVVAGLSLLQYPPARLASKIGAAALTRDLYHTALDVIDRGSQPDLSTP